MRKNLLANYFILICITSFITISQLKELFIALQGRLQYESFCFKPFIEDLKLCEIISKCPT